MAEKEYLEREKAKGKFSDHLPIGRSIRDTLDEVPAADVVEVVHGEWLGWGKGGMPLYENYGTCSVCHEDAEICTEHRNFCPNCGAKMDGERRSENETMDF